jgi:hypothetical protein
VGWRIEDDGLEGPAVLGQKWGEEFVGGCVSVWGLVSGAVCEVDEEGAFCFELMGCLG